MLVVSAVLLGLALAANGFFMLYDPAGWYGLVPGVPDTGPLTPISSAISAAPTR